MTQLIRFTFGAAATVASVLVAAPVRAQVACDTLPNPIIVTGSIAFEPVLKQFAVRLAAESPPATIITVGVFSQTTSCAGIDSVVKGKDFGGLPGRYYTLSATSGAGGAAGAAGAGGAGGAGGATIINNTCTFAAGQTAHVAISDVFYESCPNVPQPRPADIADTQGPVQAAVFITATTNITKFQYLRHGEARAIYGCGVSGTRAVAGFFSNPEGVFCLGADSGTQVTIARNLGLAESVLTAPRCLFKASDAKMAADLIPRPQPPCVPTDSVCNPPTASIGFVSAGELDANRGALDLLAFQALGQTQAFYPDSGPTVRDRKNVRDGHYPLWGYLHLIAKTTGGSVGPQASELIGWINATKTSARIDGVGLTAAAGLIPSCAMKVKRSSDGGPISPYSPPETCHCSAEASLTRTVLASCTPCASNSGCSCGQSCRHGFCE